MIAPMTLNQLSERCNGKLIGDDRAFNSVCIDTRALAKNDLFFAIVGETFDGHDFAVSAAELASAIVVEQPQKTDVSQLVVKDTREALGYVGAHCREHFSQPVVAITGSSGKTSARNMLAAILRLRGDVCTTIANQNNEIGVPLTLLSMRSDQVAAVLELGARHVGDIRYLGQFVQPDVSILLNAGTAHIGEFGGYENIVAGKGEIYEVLKDTGTAVVNLDDPAHKVWLDKIRCKRVLTYSVSDVSANLSASEIVESSTGTRFRIANDGQSSMVSIDVPGRHNVSNALAAGAAALSLGYSLTDVAMGLKAYQPESGRLTRRELRTTLSVIDDSYNANPSSMKAGLDVLSLEDGYSIAVLGEMGELGSDAHKFHIEVAQYAAQKDIEEYWLIGTFAQAMSEVIGSKAKVFKSKEEIAEALLQLNERPTTVLLKASRFVALEGVIELFMRGSV